LRLWREEAEGKIPKDKWTDFYTSECVGCLACEPACPANVPYGHILEETRHAYVAERRWLPKLELRLAAAAVARTQFFDTALLPARALRSVGLLPHPLVFPGVTPVFQSTAAYAKELMERYRPTGPRVALLTGCLMEALFREINFATVRVLVANNVQVVVPEGQGCCGAFQEHTGIDGVEKLREINRRAFGSLGVDCAVANSAGCGLSLHKTLDGELPVRDVLGFLGEIGVKAREPREGNARVYVDLPCHLVHGQRSTIPESVLDATGYRWEFAPLAKDCCGSGGIYNIQKKENAREILAKKSAFLNEAEGDPVILATSNHVCMMQWNSARWGGMVRKPFRVRHLIQLLENGDSSNPPAKGVHNEK
jgi:glycolate oxidase iron-sulfur subunit